MKSKVEREEDRLTPPLHGWQYWGGGKWESDPTMVCSRQVSPACREVIVELKGDVKEKWPECAGIYLPVEGEHSRGRPVGSFDNNFHNRFDVGIPIQ